MADIKISGSPGPAPDEAMMAQYAEIIARLQPQIEILHSTMLRGVVVQCPGVAAHVVANIYAAACAKCLASLLTGDIQTMMMIRNGLVQAFKQGIKQVPAIQPAGPMPTPPSN